MVHNRPFDDLVMDILRIIPKKYESFNIYYGDLLYNLDQLEIIVKRFNEELAIFKGANARREELEKKRTSISSREYFEAQIEMGKQLSESLKLLNRVRAILPQVTQTSSGHAHTRL